MSEFSRSFDARQLPAGEQLLSASEAERAALAERFALVAIDRLEARVMLAPEGAAVNARGRLEAEIVQSCAVSGEDLAVRIDEPVALRFVPASAAPSTEEEIELDAAELDEIEMEGTRFDLGEALAQSLALAIDPYAVGPGAEEARRKAGIADEGASGPFGALAALKPKH